MDDSQFTEDALLGGRVQLRQPREGFRAAVDTVLLAASVPAREGQRVADLGAGVGGAALALAARVGGVAIAGLERDPALARLCNENAKRNGMEGRVACVAGDVANLPAAFAPGTFDHVMMNPPFRDEGTGTASPVAGKERANAHEGTAIADWLAAAMRLLRPKGTVTVIYDAGGMDGLIAGLKAGGAGGIDVFPFWPRAGVAAKRVVIRARKGVKTPARVLAGLVLHKAGGTFTAGAEAVLREGGAVDF